jgi:hypothetical protein
MPLTQSGQSANNVLTLEVGAEHTVYFLQQAEARAGKGAIIDVTVPAEEAWSMEVVKRATWQTTLLGCTPGSITGEGEFVNQQADPAEQFKKARQGNWSQGIAGYMQKLKEWRDEGALQGVEVTARTD